ncbi:hypothetical protein P3875_02000 [Myroides sp. JBRI-B21084]|uniref:DUF6929 family protein n=1 Tax=Myroides sp. JBRI-B21084 TaxID=3119977 RepID=UPI0026E36251|nr:hypothetical protein [Paenimyroides cloacae]WKW46866.1 hypothetical protein P3875_02000 [Paenimyroides cloacae]
MKKYFLNTWLKLTGIVAVTGVGYENDKLILATESQNVLYEYFIKNDSITNYVLNDSISDDLKSSQNYNLQTLFKVDNSYYLFGSGKDSLSSNAIIMNAFSKYTSSINITELYSEMKSFSEINDQNFNINATVTYNNDWLFLNKANINGNENYIFVVQGKNFIDEYNIFYFEFDLPKINNLQTGFTDATVINNTLFFVACANNENIGTYFGAIDLKKMKLLYTEKISETENYTGITAIEQTKKNVAFALTSYNKKENKNYTNIHKLNVLLKNKIK